MVSAVTQYTKNGDIHLAYQVIGDGPVDLVMVPGFISHIECYWEEPSFARALKWLARFSRLIIFDKRGTGLSDRVSDMPTIEQRMDDVRAVMDAAGSERAAILGVSEGGAMSTVFAATYPERTSMLILYGAFAEFSSWYPAQKRLDAFFNYCETKWGTGDSVRSYAPTLAEDHRFKKWWARFERQGASPGSELNRFGGKTEDTIGDGVLATFDGPARAIRCAIECGESVERLGLKIRAGLHTGECQLLDNKVSGITVNIGARVVREARPGEVLVSSTVKDLVAGSKIDFIERKAVKLKGVPGTWKLYAAK
jgi:pimeloyl-ACP methyl ester carboxylesterase